MAEVTIPRYAPVTNMVLKYDPEHLPSTNAWLGKYVTIPNSPAIDFGTSQSFTLEVWVKPALVQKWTSTTQITFLEKSAANPPSGAWLWQYFIAYLGNADPKAGRIMAGRYHPASEVFIVSDTAVNDGGFHHVAFVKDEVMLYLYIDGVPENNIQDQESILDTKYPVHVGGSLSESFPSFFTGDIGQVRMWNRALPATTIKQIYANAYQVRGGHRASNALLAEGLVGDWRFNEGYGTLAFDYARSNNGVLGGGLEVHRPEWVVSTILRRPTYIVDPLPGKQQTETRPEEPAPFRYLTLNELRLMARHAGPPLEAQPVAAPVEKAATRHQTKTTPGSEVVPAPAKTRVRTGAKTKTKRARPRTKSGTKR
jgi:hypothetical protein